MKTTEFEKKETVVPTWYLIDAEGLPVGRVATMVAHILRGKHRADYTPHIDMGDHIVIVNAEKITFTGRKMFQKKYYHHTGYPGGLKEITAEHQLEKHPDRVLMLAVKGMLPKNRLGRKLMKKIRIYAGTSHDHSAQQPIKIDVTEDKRIVAVK